MKPLSTFFTKINKSSYLSLFADRASSVLCVLFEYWVRGGDILALYLFLDQFE